jgi:uncharacterized Fe-S cluster protein YjdI
MRSSALRANYHTESGCEVLCSVFQSRFCVQCHAPVFKVLSGPNQQPEKNQKSSEQVISHSIPFTSNCRQFILT